jgi:hypothetical protein
MTRVPKRVYLVDRVNEIGTMRYMQYGEPKPEKGLRFYTYERVVTKPTPKPRGKAKGRRR